MFDLQVWQARAAEPKLQAGQPEAVELKEQDFEVRQLEEEQTMRLQ